MKLTKEHVESCQDHPLLTVRELCDDWLAMRAVLEELQYTGPSNAYCGSCGADWIHGGHATNCKLKELLEGDA